MGISFYTKLLFFLRQQRAGDRPAYILDQFTAKSARLLFPGCPIQLTAGGYPQPDTRPQDYEWFCAALEDLGRHIDPQNPWTGEEVEMALFDKRGGEWRKYVRDSIPTKKPPKRRPSLTKGQSTTKPSHSVQLAEMVAREHVRAHEAEDRLPRLNGSVTAGAMVNCGKSDGVEWHYVVKPDQTRAAVFIFKEQRHRYDQLREFLGIAEHDFGAGILGTGFKNGKTCKIHIILPEGSSSPPDQWPDLAHQAVAAMSKLFTTVAEII